MISERAADLKAQIELLHQAKTGEKVGETLITLHNKIRQQADMLQKAVDRVRILRSIGISIEMDRDFCFQQKMAWQTIAATQSSDPTFLRDAGVRTRQDNQRQLDILCKQLSEGCDLAWKQYVARESPQQPDPLLMALFERDPAHKSNIALIRERLMRIANHADRFPDSDRQARLFGEYCTFVRDTWESILGADLPIPVKLFFAEMAKSNTRRVSLALLTPEVQQWMKEKNVIEQFYIGAG